MIMYICYVHNYGGVTGCGVTPRDIPHATCLTVAKCMLILVLADSIESSSAGGRGVCRKMTPPIQRWMAFKELGTSAIPTRWGFQWGGRGGPPARAGFSLGIESDNAKEIREALSLPSPSARQRVLPGSSEETLLHVLRVRTVSEDRDRQTGHGVLPSQVAQGRVGVNLAGSRDAGWRYGASFNPYRRGVQ